MNMSEDQRAGKIVEPIFPIGVSVEFRRRTLRRAGAYTLCSFISVDGSLALDSRCLRAPDCATAVRGRAGSQLGRALWSIH
jgi:hypothetical protein